VKLPGFVATFWGALKAWWKDDAPRLGAALAYYTLFALAPVLLIAIAIAGQFFGPEAVRGEIVRQVEGLMGREAATGIQTLLEGASGHHSGTLAAILGTLTFLITASGAFLELQTALNTIWRVKPRADAPVKRFLLNRAQSFGLVLAIGFLLLVSLVVSAGVSAAAGWLQNAVQIDPLIWNAANAVISLAVATVLFALLFKYLPDVELRWRDVWAGAVATSLLFTIGKFFIGLYIARSSTASSYGAAGSILVLLIWVYYSAQIVLLGAEYTRIQAERSGGKPAPRRAIARKDTAPRKHAKTLP
jgi:membrane protein